MLTGAPLSNSFRRHCKWRSTAAYRRTQMSSLQHGLRVGGHLALTDFHSEDTKWTLNCWLWLWFIIGADPPCALPPPPESEYRTKQRLQKDDVQQMESANRWRLLQSQTPAHDVAALRRKVFADKPKFHLVRHVTSRRACRAVLFDMLDTAKMLGLDT